MYQYNSCPCCLWCKLKKKYDFQVQFSFIQISDWIKIQLNHYSRSIWKMSNPIHQPLKPLTIRKKKIKRNHINPAKIYKKHVSIVAISQNCLSFSARRVNDKKWIVCCCRIKERGIRWRAFVERFGCQWAVLKCHFSAGFTIMQPVARPDTADGGIFR